MVKKFKRGDVVRYLGASELCEEFTSKFGTGPFVVLRWRDPENVFLLTMDGEPMLHPTLRRGSVRLCWHHGVEALVKDEFLSAVNRATSQTKKEQQNERKDQKRRAIGHH